MHKLLHFRALFQSLNNALLARAYQIRLAGHDGLQGNQDVAWGVVA